MAEMQIVCAFDTMVGFRDGALTADRLAHKMNGLHRDWLVLFAGDITEGTRIIESVKSAYVASGEFLAPLSCDRVMEDVSGAYKARLRQRINNEILSPYGLNLATYNPADNAELRARIDWMVTKDFSCDLLVVGFTAPKEPHIFSVSSPGDAVLHDVPCFWAIGSGAELALGSIASGEVYGSTDGQILSKCIWEVLVAKFTAERAYGVGAATEAWIQRFEGSSPVPLNVINEVKKSWRRREAQRLRIPRKTIAALQKFERSLT